MAISLVALGACGQTNWKGVAHTMVTACATSTSKVLAKIDASDPSGAPALASSAKTCASGARLLGGAPHPDEYTELSKVELEGIAGDLAKYATALDTDNAGQAASWRDMIARRLHTVAEFDSKIGKYS